MAAENGGAPQSILKWGIIVQFVANLTMGAVGRIDGDCRRCGLGAMRMFSVGTQGLVGANTQACFMAYFRESASANGYWARSNPSSAQA